MTTSDRARLRVEVTQAARIVPPLWPIERFIAVNPLQGLLELGFEDAAAEARRWFGATTHPGHRLLSRALVEGDLDQDDLRAALITTDPSLATASSDHLDRVIGGVLAGAEGPRRPPAARTVTERHDADRGGTVAPSVDIEVARWCGFSVSRGHTPFPTPGGDRGAYRAWQETAVRDRRLRRLAGRRAGQAIAALPSRADDALALGLERLGVGHPDRVDELRGQIARLPGWSSYARWCDEWAGPDDPSPRLGLVDLLAIRVNLDALALAHAVGRTRPDRWSPVSGPDLAPDPHPDDTTVGRVALTALEGAYRRRLLVRLERDPVAGPAAPTAQAVFCIDARSEALRRNLEARGAYDTFGFAGFFAVPLRHRPLGSTESYPSAPVLFDPNIEVPEVAPVGAEHQAEVALARADLRQASAETVDALGHGPLSMYALAEGAGWVLGPVALLRTLRPHPTGRAGPLTRVEVSETVAGTGFSLEERTLIAETALQTMGLTSAFAPLVLLCGHRSTTRANPHAAALDCGACGGNRGGPNARAAAAIFNDEDVRSALRGRGLDIPSSTWFVAGEHDTTTDRVEVFDRDGVPSTHQEAVDRLLVDLDAAGERLALERLARLADTRTSASPSARVQARSADWAETRPEWGLARNAAFIVGPRDLTRGLDLEGRTFLHSYRAGIDPDGTALETILTAPMVVAQWINAQYYFSTVDPDVYGAGDKTLHNPVAGIGVVVGAGGDLRGGLPRQSVMNGDDVYHQPLRLLTVVEAPRDRIDAVIGRNPVLRHLFDGAWVQLMARDQPDADWHIRSPAGDWTATSATDRRPQEVPA